MTTHLRDNRSLAAYGFLAITAAALLAISPTVFAAPILLLLFMGGVSAALTKYVVGPGRTGNFVADNFAPGFLLMGLSVLAPSVWLVNASFAIGPDPALGWTHVAVALCVTLAASVLISRRIAPVSARKDTVMNFAFVFNAVSGLAWGVITFASSAPR